MVFFLLKGRCFFLPKKLHPPLLSPPKANLESTLSSDSEADTHPSSSTVSDPCDGLEFTKPRLGS
jgi:hypothetical protein